MPKRFYKFVHLQLSSVKDRFVHLRLFNVKYKFVHLQLFGPKLLFSEKHIFRKQKRMAVCERASIFSGFKLCRENYELLSLRHKWIFKVRHPLHDLLECGFPTKGIQLTWFVLYPTNMVRTFWGTWGAQPWGTSVYTISVGIARKSTENKRSYKLRN